MKKIHLAILVFAVLLLAICHQNLAANLPPARGGVLPGISLPVPNDPDEKSYLGVSGSGFFRIPQIKAEVVIIEIFSMYCPQCQKIAPGLDELYRLIESNPDLRNKIKIIGIGAGNSRYEVEVFKKTYHTPFPVFPDNEFDIHKALGDVRSPYFIVIRINQEGTPKVVHSELDSFKEAHTFLELITKASGLEP
jgi:thiol-disulfide isomerase/thioredoxin